MSVGMGVSRSYHFSENEFIRGSKLQGRAQVSLRGRSTLAVALLRSGAMAQ